MSKKVRTDLEKNRTKLRKFKNVLRSCGATAAAYYHKLHMSPLSSFSQEVKRLSEGHDFKALIIKGDIAKAEKAAAKKADEKSKAKRPARTRARIR